MQPDPLLEDVIAQVQSLESLCGQIERSLTSSHWDEMSAAFADSRRVTHALQNAMDAAENVRNAAFDERVFKRVRHIYALREHQLQRLRAYHEALGEKLKQIASWKRTAGVFDKKFGASQLANLDSLS